MKPASLVIDAVNRWSINNSARKLRRFTAAIVMTHNSHHVAMAVAKYFVLVRIIHTNIFDHIFVVPFPFFSILVVVCVVLSMASEFFVVVVLLLFYSLSLFLFHRSQRIRLYRSLYEFVILFVILVVLAVFLMRTFISILCVFHIAPSSHAPTAQMCVHMSHTTLSLLILFYAHLITIYSQRCHRRV